MRTPIENGFASSHTPRSCSTWNVSRALCPTARTTTGVGRYSPVCRCRPRRRRPPSAATSMSKSSTRCSKRYSPPSASILTRSCSTTRTRRNVPMCGCAFDENFGRRAGGDEFGEHLPAEMPRVLDLAPQLAVGKRAGAALPELHVRFRVQHALPPEAPGVLGPFTHDLAAVDDDRSKAHLGQQQSREKTARSGADDHGSGMNVSGDRRGDETIAQIRSRADALAVLASEDGDFVGDVDIDRVHHRDGRLLPRIVRAAGDPIVEQILGVDGQSRQPHPSTRHRYGRAVNAIR